MVIKTINDFSSKMKYARYLAKKSNKNLDTIYDKIVRGKTEEKDILNFTARIVNFDNKFKSKEFYKIKNRVKILKYRYKYTCLNINVKEYYPIIQKKITKFKSKYPGVLHTLIYLGDKEATFNVSNFTIVSIKIALDHERGDGYQKAISTYADITDTQLAHIALNKASKTNDNYSDIDIYRQAANSVYRKSTFEILHKTIKYNNKIYSRAGFIVFTGITSHHLKKFLSFNPYLTGEELIDSYWDIKSKSKKFKQFIIDEKLQTRTPS